MHGGGVYDTAGIGLGLRMKVPPHSLRISYRAIGVRVRVPPICRGGYMILQALGLWSGSLLYAGGVYDTAGIGVMVRVPPSVVGVNPKPMPAVSYTPPAYRCQPQT